MNRPLVIGIAIVGTLLASLAAFAFEMSAADAVSMVAWAAGAAGVAGLVGAGALWAMKRSSIGVQVAIVALTSVAAVAAGAFVSANKMFFSLHDLRSLLVVLVAAGTVGLIAATILAARVARASASLGEATERIGAGEVFRPTSSPSATEFEDLAKHLESMSAKLEEARRRERALDTSRRELIAWVSHDLRTPLAGIRAMAEALEDGVVVDPETTARYHHAMRVETDRLAGLVDDLFELSRINAGTLRLQMERASLGDLVSDALAAAAASADARGVKLEGRLTSDAPELDLSVPEMARVFRNLLENAIRHTPSDGTVTVEAGIEGENAYVAVADSCGGIPQSDIDRVFDVAFRGQSARTPDGGTGLGLAIASGIVKAHHGEIDVRNQGAGCRFVVRLPLEDAADRP
jgi:signal transduction histidine kinase